MATSLTKFFIDAVLKVDMLNTVQGKGIPAKGVGHGFSLGSSFSDGTSANQADAFIFEIDRTLSSTSENLDMYDLAAFDAATDIYGNAVTFAEIVAILIQCESTSTTNLLVGGLSATTAWNSIFNGDDDAKIPVHPGGFLMLVAPDDPAYAVADTSNHLLKMEASGGNVTYNLAILGRSA